MTSIKTIRPGEDPIILGGDILIHRGLIPSVTERIGASGTYLRADVPAHPDGRYLHVLAKYVTLAPATTAFRVGEKVRVSADAKMTVGWRDTPLTVSFEKEVTAAVVKCGVGTYDEEREGVLVASVRAFAADGREKTQYVDESYLTKLDFQEDDQVKVLTGAHGATDDEGEVSSFVGQAGRVIDRVDHDGDVRVRFEGAATDYILPEFLEYVPVRSEPKPEVKTFKVGDTGVITGLAAFAGKSFTLKTMRLDRGLTWPYGVEVEGLIGARMFARRELLVNGIDRPVPRDLVVGDTGVIAATGRPSGAIGKAFTITEVRDIGRLFPYRADVEGIRGVRWSRDELVVDGVDREAPAKVEETVAAVVADMVAHPTHYNSHPKGIEAITVIEDNPSYNLGASMKYLWRVSWGSKGNDIEDLQKAKQYIDFEIARRETAACS